MSLSYIRDYEASSAALIVDWMEELVAATGERGFHFVDEAAPPASMKAVALEILARRITMIWWTNIRFEKSFTANLCRLLAASGCIAVSGGLEVASDRLLALIDKGVTVPQVARVNIHFHQAVIVVHAYLMYGFPTQTAQETAGSLEVVRQLFEQGMLQSAFWHRFAMTAHSPVGLAPAESAVHNETPAGTFANNDLTYADPTGADHDLYGEGLKKSLHNYMHGVGIEYDMREWFGQEVPETSLPPDLIYEHLVAPGDASANPNQKVVWIGGAAGGFCGSGTQGLHAVLVAGGPWTRCGSWGWRWCETEDAPPYFTPSPYAQNQSQEKARHQAHGRDAMGLGQQAAWESRVVRVQARRAEPHLPQVRERQV